MGGEAKVKAALECEGHREAGKALLVYGFIKYRDAFTADRETRFGYKISEDNKFHRIVGKGDFWQYNSFT